MNQYFLWLLLCDFYSPFPGFDITSYNMCPYQPFLLHVFVPYTDIYRTFLQDRAKKKGLHCLTMNFTYNIRSCVYIYIPDYETSHSIDNKLKILRPYITQSANKYIYTHTTCDWLSRFFVFLGKLFWLKHNSGQQVSDDVYFEEENSCLYPESNWHNGAFPEKCHGGAASLYFLVYDISATILQRCSKALTKQNWKL